MTDYPIDFSKWTTDLVHTTFGIKKVAILTSMEAWLNFVPPPLTIRELGTLQLALEQFGDRARFVSESDIKMKLLGAALNASRFDNHEFSTFGEVHLKTTLTTAKGEKIKVAGRPDLVVALGEFEARLPYFCMQEYKKQFSTKADPQGQVLIEMLAARQLNLNARNPLQALYGAFTIGRELNFLTLEGTHYTISKTFLLDVEQDLIDVTLLMRALKYIIADLIGVKV